MAYIPQEIISSIFSYVPRDRDMSSPTAAIFKEGCLSEISKLEYQENKLWEQVYENRCDVNSITFNVMLKTYNDMIENIQCKTYRKYYRKIWLWLFKIEYPDDN